MGYDKGCFMIDLEKDLNEEQRKMVQEAAGPILVLAGAGSGKTKALTYRIAHLIVKKNISPESILAITFTNKAAGEIKERVKKLIQGSEKFQDGHNGGSVAMGTFHSICARILRKEAHFIGYPNNFVIFDEDDSKKTIKKVLVKLGASDDKALPKLAKSLISSAKNELIEPKEYVDFVDKFQDKNIANIYQAYQKELEKNEAMDFDDLIFNVVRIFQKNPEVLKKYQRIWQYILIDEYQDTNHAQYVFAKMLAEGHGNICVVGDDWQSVYSWRGANFRNILDFEKDWPGAKVYRLERNYRSSGVIIKAAQSVIEKNKLRSAKELWTKNKDGESIEVYEASSEEDEAIFIINTLKNLKEKGISFSEVAVFYRTNAQSRSIEEGFLRNKVPYKIVGGVRFYERKEIKDALAWLRIASGANDWIAFERTLISPPCGIGKVTISKMHEIAESNNFKISDLSKMEIGSILNNKVAQNLSGYFAKIDKIKSANSRSLSDAVETTIKVTGLVEYLSDGTFESEERVENLKELLSVVKELEATRSDISLEGFLEEVALISDLDSYEKNDEGVTLMTLHTSKGLEFRAVFIVGMEENIFPHSRSLLDFNEIEEERRLFYVGMTRAKELLYLTHANRRLYFGGMHTNQPSRFLAEIPLELIKFAGAKEGINKDLPPKSNALAFFAVGDNVEHEFFGKGKVIEVIDDEITADFNVYGKKTVSIEYAPIRKI